MPLVGVIADVRAAVRALDDRVVYCIRGPADQPLLHLPGGDIDVVIPKAARESVEAALQAAGFRRLHARGHAGHQFYVGRDEQGRWQKLDVLWRLNNATARADLDALLARRTRTADAWVMDGEDYRRHRELRQQDPSSRRRPWHHRLIGLLPLQLRRSGPVIAIVGPDGAGKSTALASAAAQLPVAVHVTHLGWRRRRPRSAASPPARPPGALRETLGLVRMHARWWGRLARAYVAAWRGDIVLCDRHPLEALAVRPRRTPFAARVEGLLLWLLPRPDRVVVLDAPAALMFERKQEHTVETLRHWRAGYLATFGRDGCVIDTARPQEQVTAELLTIVWRELAARRAWAQLPASG